MAFLPSCARGFWVGGVWGGCGEPGVSIRDSGPPGSWFADLMVSTVRFGHCHSWASPCPICLTGGGKGWHRFNNSVTPGEVSCPSCWLVFSTSERVDPVTCFKTQRVYLCLCASGIRSACCLHLLRLRGSWLQKVRGPGTSLWPSSCVSDSPRAGAAPSPNSSCLKMGSLRGSSEAPPTQRHTRKG